LLLARRVVFGATVVIHRPGSIYDELLKDPAKILGVVYDQHTPYHMASTQQVLHDTQESSSCCE
jgi:hypothetical protein